MQQTFFDLRGHAGHHQVPDQACELLDFAKLTLTEGQTHEGRMDDDREALLVMLTGTADVTVNGIAFTPVGGRGSVFAGTAHSVYVPRGASYSVTGRTAVEAALPSSPSDQDIEPYEIRPEGVATGQWGTLNFTRYFRKILVHGDGRPASRLIVGETITPSGNWSTYPPHKHEVTEGGEVYHEEMYYFRNGSPDGYGLAQHYSPERGYDHVHRVTHDSLLSMPHGYHCYAGAPGSHSYYLWFLAGDGRAQGTSFDPALGWVQNTVGMLE